jgi:microcompartment protein CcmL/EutN
MSGDPVAIAAIETSSIAQGWVTADAMVKEAEVQVLQSSTLSPGRYWIMIGGDVAEIRAAHRRGVEMAGDTLLDQLLIPQLDEAVLPALRGTVPASDDDAVGVLETLTAASAVVAADRAAKAARIVVRDVRLANGIGGKGIVVVSGPVSEVQAAVDEGRREARARGLHPRAVVIPRMDARLRARIV